MGKDYILVIDEGTTGTRAILFDKKFQIAEQSYEEFCQHTPAENMVEHDAEEIYDLSVKMCKNEKLKMHIKLRALVREEVILEEGKRQWPLHCNKLLN